MFARVYTHSQTETCVTGDRDKIVKWQSEVNIQRFPTGSEINYRQKARVGYKFFRNQAKLILGYSEISLVPCFTVCIPYVWHYYNKVLKLLIGFVQTF